MTDIKASSALDGKQQVGGSRDGNRDKDDTAAKIDLTDKVGRGSQQAPDLAEKARRMSATREALSGGAADTTPSASPGPGPLEDLAGTKNQGPLAELTGAVKGQGPLADLAGVGSGAASDPFSALKASPASPGAVPPPKASPAGPTTTTNSSGTLPFNRPAGNVSPAAAAGSPGGAASPGGVPPGGMPPGGPVPPATSGAGTSTPMTDAALRVKSFNDDQQQAHQIYMTMAAERQKWFMQLWQIMQDLQTTVFKIMQDVMLRRQQVVEQSAERWAKLIGGGGE